MDADGNDPGAVPEAEVVLDPGGAAGLTADGDVFDDDHVETFRGPVYGGRQSRRSGSHDEHVTPRSVGDVPPVDAECRRQIPCRRRGYHPALSGDHRRAGAGQRARPRQIRPGRRVGAQHRAVRELVTLGEVLETMQVAAVVSGEDEAALAQLRQYAPPGVERGEQDITQLPRDLHQRAKVLDPDPQQLGPVHGNTGQERPLSHQHPQLADEVAFFDHEHDAVVATVEEEHPSGEDEVEIVWITGVPELLAGLGAQHAADRPQHVQGVLGEHRPRRGLGAVPPMGRVDGPPVGRWNAAHGRISGLFRGRRRHGLPRGWPGPLCPSTGDGPADGIPFVSNVPVSRDVVFARSRRSRRR
jgi:hypothetical protein